MSYFAQIEKVIEHITVPGRGGFRGIDVYMAVEKRQGYGMMDNDIKVEKATISNLDDISKLYDITIEWLHKQEIYQWEKGV